MRNRDIIQELYGLSKTSIDLCRDSWCPGLDSNRASPQNKTTALSLDQSVLYIGIYRSYIVYIN